MHEEYNWSTDLIAARDGHLESVVSALRDAGVPVDEIENIREDLQQQIISMCAERCGQESLSLDILDTVLDELDSPASVAGGDQGDNDPVAGGSHIAEGPEEKSAAPSTLLARYALMLCIFGILVGPLVHSFEDSGDAGWNLYFFAQLAALVCALCSQCIQRSPKHLFSRVTLWLVTAQAILLLFAG